MLFLHPLLFLKKMKCYFPNNEISFDNNLLVNEWPLKCSVDVWLCTPIATINIKSSSVFSFLPYNWKGHTHFLVLEFLISSCFMPFLQIRLTYCPFLSKFSVGLGNLLPFRIQSIFIIYLLKSLSVILQISELVIKKIIKK